MKNYSQKKKSITIWFLCAFCMVVLLGCGGISVDTQSDNATDKIEIQDNNTTDKVEIQDENTTDTTEIENTPSEGWANAYQDGQGRILYISSDYGKAGMQSAACTEGYYYLENEEVVSVAIRSYMLEYDENEEEIYTYYLSDWDTPIEKEEWEKAGQNFLTDKEALDVSICWKSLYETKIAEKKASGWFLLLAESLDGAV